MGRVGLNAGLWLDGVSIARQPSVSECGKDRGDDQYKSGNRTAAEVELPLVGSVEETVQW